MRRAAADVVNDHPGQTLIGDKNYFGKDFEKELTERELALLRLITSPVPAAGPIRAFCT